MNPGNGSNPPQPQFSQVNNPSGGTVYSSQGTGNQIINLSSTQRGIRVDTKVLLVALIVDVIFFVYGMEAYTGRNTNADTWRAGIFLVMIAVNGTLIRRWLRHRL